MQVERTWAVEPPRSAKSIYQSSTTTGRKWWVSGGMVKRRGGFFVCFCSGLARIGGWHAVGRFAQFACLGKDL